jgi:hypothetical protein
MSWVCRDPTIIVDHDKICGGSKCPYGNSSRLCNDQHEESQQHQDMRRFEEVCQRSDPMLLDDIRDSGTGIKETVKKTIMNTGLARKPTIRGRLALDGARVWPLIRLLAFRKLPSLVKDRRWAAR